MADYSVSIVTRRTWQARLPNPTVGAEWRKASSYAHSEFGRIVGRAVKWDDDITIRADDDGIYIEFALPPDSLPDPGAGRLLAGEDKP